MYQKPDQFTDWYLASTRIKGKQQLCDTQCFKHQCIYRCPQKKI